MTRESERYRATAVTMHVTPKKRMDGRYWRSGKKRVGGRYWRSGKQK